MKLSKTQLKSLIGGSGCCDWNCDSYKEAKYEHFKSSVLNSLWDDTLEIEGYERVQWVKFNPNDPKTFPPQTEEGYIIAYKNGTVATGIWWGVEKIFISVPHKKGITHWRPLPKPPIETE